MQISLIQDFKVQHNSRIYSDSSQGESECQMLTGRGEELGMEEGNALLRNVIAADNNEGAYSNVYSDRRHISIGRHGAASLTKVTCQN